jgi:hypothetical protein
MPTDAPAYEITPLTSAVITAAVILDNLTKQDRFTRGEHLRAVSQLEQLQAAVADAKAAGANRAGAVCVDFIQAAVEVAAAHVESCPT